MGGCEDDPCLNCSAIEITNKTNGLSIDVLVPGLWDLPRLIVSGAH